MNVYESVGSYVMVYECLLKRMDVYEPIWRYMKVYDSKGM